MSGIRITEKKRILIACCVEHPVYLCWINKLGAFEYWLFGFNHTNDDDVQEIDTFYPYRPELSDAVSWQEVLSKRAIPKMVIGASNIDVENVSGLRGLLHSPRILMMTNPPTAEEVEAYINDGTPMPWQEDGPQWIVVKVQPNTFRLSEARASKCSVEIVLVLQEVQIQRQ